MNRTWRLGCALVLLAGIARSVWAAPGAADALAAPARAKELAEAIRRALPAFDNDPTSDTRVVETNGVKWTFHEARMKGHLVGAACRSRAEGYGGPIEVLVGIRADGTVNAVEILDASTETPGIGSKVCRPEFLKRFQGKSADDTRWAALTKDGGDIQAVTRATLSSRGVTEAVKAALDAYRAQSQTSSPRRQAIPTPSATRADKP